MAAIIQFIQWINGGVQIHPDNGMEAEQAQNVFEIENMNRNRNLAQRGIKARHLVALSIFVFVSASIVMYVSIGGYTLDSSYADLKAAQVQHTMVTFYRNETTCTFEAKILLRVCFSMSHELKAYPKLGTFVLSMKLNKTQTLHAYSKGEYNISSNDQVYRPLFLNFTTYIQEAELEILQGKLHDLSTLWINVHGDLKMDVKLSRFPLLPKARRHTYFLCDVPFTPSHPNKTTNIKDCMTSHAPIDD